MTSDSSAQSLADDQNSTPAPGRGPASPSKEHSGGTAKAVLVTLPAEIDITNDSQVQDMLAAALDGRPAVVIVDGSQTTFCGSATVDLLLDVHRRAASAGAELRLVAPAAGVRRILQLTGAADELCVYSSLYDAALAEGTRPMSPPATSACC